MAVRPFIRRGLVSSAALGVVAFVAGCVALDRYGQKGEFGRAQAIVVLGARVLPGGVASGALRARLERAVDLYKEGAAPLLIFSGGLGDHAPTEAQVMLDLAVALGVPPEACVLEEQSHSTYDNAKFTAEILRSRGISEVVVVSDPYHLYRARQNFRLQGIEAKTVPALLSERNITLSMRVWSTFREAVALMRRPALFFARAPKSPTRGG